MDKGEPISPLKLSHHEFTWHMKYMAYMEKAYSFSKCITSAAGMLSYVLQNKHIKHSKY